MANEIGYGKFTTKMNSGLSKGEFLTFVTPGRVSVWSINKCSLSSYCVLNILLSVTPGTENFGSRN